MRERVQHVAQRGARHRRLLGRPQRHLSLAVASRGGGEDLGSFDCGESITAVANNSMLDKNMFGIALTMTSSELPTADIDLELMCMGRIVTVAEFDDAQM